MKDTKVINAYYAALDLIASSTSGWTWEKAVDQVAVAFWLNAEEANQVMYANK